MKHAGIMWGGESIWELSRQVHVEMELLVFLPMSNHRLGPRMLGLHGMRLTSHLPEGVLTLLANSSWSARDFCMFGLLWSCSSGSEGVNLMLDQ